MIQIYKQTLNIHKNKLFLFKILSMQVIELRNIITHRISEINDISFLKAIKKILDTKSETKIISLNDLLKKEIETSQKEVKAGMYISGDKLNDEVKEWLQES